MVLKIRLCPWCSGIHPSIHPPGRDAVPLTARGRSRGLLRCAAGSVTGPRGRRRLRTGCGSGGGRERTELLTC
ncbi:hypothetical protein OJAV_G00071580 [Oryzias javanicus]|uniref:Uncharacterized protein n=1 Tax=Oryzias javanicus TaxID=123683 RepID=A0A3S2PVV8_ORYJA|nr:hypothetical protein OJAV_G00071580 [Oryzias javanicus]